MRTLLICAMILPFFISPLLAQQSKIESDVINQFEQQNIVDCMITMTEQVELKKRTKGLTKKEKAILVYRLLKNHADRNQIDLRQFMDNQKIEYQAFYVFNGFRAQLTMDQALFVVGNFDVATISFNQPVQVQAVQKNDLNFRTDAEWGIEKIGADSVWALGFEGEGVIVAGQDTGYDFDNPLILNKYRGYSEAAVDHNYNWHDAIHEINSMHEDSIPDATANPCGLSSLIPCDDNNHGTHTMGTMVGQDDDNFIGLAPKAKWMACRNMDRGYGTPATYTECFEWFLAPTDLNGQNPNPAMAPHVINNSWSCPEIEGCNSTNWMFMETVVNNLSAAGTVVVVSAGNEGRQGCETLNTPAAIFAESITVGATQDNDVIADFSSIGPVGVDGSQRLKPDIVAPGVGIRSIVLNEHFETWNGTSMAGPHVAGAVALLINANPNLAGDVDQIREILTSTAVPLTSDTICNGITANETPNFVYGHGRLDILAAVEKALTITSNSNLANINGDVKVIPNPNSGEFKLKSNAGIIKNIFIYDSLGRIVRELGGGFSEINIQLNNSKGIYYYRLNIDNQSQLGKIVLR